MIFSCLLGRADFLQCVFGRADILQCLLGRADILVFIRYSGYSTVFIK